MGTFKSDHGKMDWRRNEPVPGRHRLLHNTCGARGGRDDQGNITNAGGSLDHEESISGRVCFWTKSCTGNRCPINTSDQEAEQRGRSATNQKSKRYSKGKGSSKRSDQGC